MASLCLPKVYVKDESFTPPENEPIYYLVTGSGLFKVMHMPLFSSISRVTDGVRGLQHQEEELTLRLPRIPKVLMELAVGFFAEVYREYKSEAVLLIHHNAAKNRYRLVAPPQTVTRVVYPWYTYTEDEVAYEAVNVPPGWQQVGSIHSHGNMPAFQSWQDAQDVRFKDGLHIVVGRVNWRPEFDVAFVVGGRRFRLAFDEACEGFDQPILPPPRAWWQKVVCKTIVRDSYGWGDTGYGYGGYYSKPVRYDEYRKRPD